MCTYPDHRRQAGYSLLEVLIVVSIIGILANIGIPVLLDALADAEAAAVLGDVDAILKAASRHRVDAGEYPSSAAWRTTPPALSDTLDGMPFERGDIWYRWYGTPTWHGLLLLAQSNPRPLDSAHEQWSGRSIRAGNLLLLYEFH